VVYESKVESSRVEPGRVEQQHKGEAERKYGCYSCLCCVLCLCLGCAEGVLEYVLPGASGGEEGCAWCAAGA
jgi:hypothetical protein